MKNLRIVVLGLFLMCTGVFQGFSQSIYFCEDYTASGEPLRSGNAFTISGTGNYVYTIYKQPRNLTQLTVWLYVDKLSGDSYLPYKTVELAANKYTNWILYDVFYDKPGKYKVSIQSGGTALATEYITISSSDVDNSTTETSYTNSSIKFCESVSGGAPVGVYSTFTISPSGGYVNVYVDNVGQALNTTGLIVDVYRKDGETYKFVETKKYTDLDPGLSACHFKYTFYTRGEYKLAVYNKESKLIKNGYVTIQYKD